MGLSFAAIHEALINNPSLVFVQDTEGTLKLLQDSHYRFPCSPSDHVCYNVYSGSFNPLHDGHRAIFQAIENGHQYQFEHKFFELSISRYGKDPVDALDMEKRLRQFVGYASVLITNVSRFVEKAGVLLNADVIRFHVGADTLTRILECSSTLEVEGWRARFVYYNRIMGSTMVQLPEKLPRSCNPGAEIPEDLMRISSTALRNAGKVLT